MVVEAPLWATALRVEALVLEAVLVVAAEVPLALLPLDLVKSFNLFQLLRDVREFLGGSDCLKRSLTCKESTQ